MWIGGDGFDSRRSTSLVPDGLVDLPRLIHEALRGSIPRGTNARLVSPRRGPSGRGHWSATPVEVGSIPTRVSRSCPRSSMDRAPGYEPGTREGSTPSVGVSIVFVVKRTSRVRPKDALLVRLQPKTSVSPRALGGRCLSYGQSRRFDSVTRDSTRTSTRGVAQWKRARFGTERSWVRPPPPRLCSQAARLCSQAVSRLRSRTRSSAGRAAVLQTAGRGFDSLPVHLWIARDRRLCGRGVTGSRTSPRRWWSSYREGSSPSVRIRIILSSPGGVTGKRAGLRSRWSPHREGSSPSLDNAHEGRR